MIPFAEHRPETVPVDVWTEYVDLMTAAGYGKARPAGFARMNEIYAQAPEIRDAGRGIDFSPRCLR
jgi:hypothetical protein